MLIDICFQVGNGCTGGTLYTLPTCQNLSFFPGIEPGSQGYKTRVQPLGDMGRSVLKFVVSRLKKGCDYSFCIAFLKVNTDAFFLNESRRLTKKT